MSQAAPAQAQSTARGGRSLAEWVTFGVAATVLLVVVGIIAYDWFVTPPSPPVLSATLSGPVEQVNDQFQVRFEVSNSGGQTAEAVQVLAKLTRDGKVVEDGEQAIDFLSAGESEQGAFLFTSDPEQGELTVRVGSYKLP